jgi:hypothetical protein
MMEFITFKRMITPILIQIVFWLAVVAIVIGGAITAVVGLTQIGGRTPAAGITGVVGGIAIILFGPLVARIYAEILIVIFRINETLTDLGETLAKENRGVSQP